MSVAGYKTQLKKGGTPTQFLNEPLIAYGSRVFRITNPIKRVLSPNHAVVVRDTSDDSIVTPQSINYLDGVILLANDTDGANGLELDGYYIPLSFIGGTKEYNLEIGGDVLDNTAFHSATEACPGFRSRAYGLHDASLSFSRWNDLVNTIRDAKMAETPIFVLVNPGGSKTKISGWFIVETDAFSGEIAALEDEAISLVLHGTLETSLSYIFDYTTAEAQAVNQNVLIANYFPNAIINLTPGMEITGVLTNDGEPVTFEPLLYAGIYIYDSKPAYTSSGVQNDIGITSSIFWIGSEWIIYHLDGASWSSNQNVATPDLVTVWTPVNLASGTPIVSPA